MMKLTALPGVRLMRLDHLPPREELQRTRKTGLLFGILPTWAVTVSSKKRREHDSVFRVSL